MEISNDDQNSRAGNIFRIMHLYCVKNWRVKLYIWNNCQTKGKGITKENTRPRKMKWNQHKDCQAEERNRWINRGKSRDKKRKFQRAYQRVTILPSLYKLRHAQHLHWWREYNISPEPRKLSFSPQPQWPLTTCCLSIYILDVVRTSSSYVSS